VGARSWPAGWACACGLVTPAVSQASRSWAAGRGSGSGKEHVAWLEVTVDHASGVDRRQRLGQAGREAVEHARAERPAAAHMLGQRRAPDVLRHQVRAGRLGVRLDDADRAQPLDAGEQCDLAPEPGAELLVIAYFRPQHLDRDLAVVPGLREVDHPHAASAKSRRQAEPPDPGRVTFPEGRQSHPEPPLASRQSRQMVASAGRPPLLMIPNSYPPPGGRRIALLARPPISLTRGH